MGRLGIIALPWSEGSIFMGSWSIIRIRSVIADRLMS